MTGGVKLNTGFGLLGSKMPGDQSNSDNGSHKGTSKEAIPKAHAEEAEEPALQADNIEEPGNKTLEATKGWVMGSTYGGSRYKSSPADPEAYSGHEPAQVQRTNSGNRGSYNFGRRGQVGFMGGGSPSNYSRGGYQSNRRVQFAAQPGRGMHSRQRSLSHANWRTPLEAEQSQVGETELSVYGQGNPNQDYYVPPTGEPILSRPEYGTQPGWRGRGGGFAGAKPNMTTISEEQFNQALADSVSAALGRQFNPMDAVQSGPQGLHGSELVPAASMVHAQPMGARNFGRRATRANTIQGHQMGPPSAIHRHDGTRYGSHNRTVSFGGFSNEQPVQRPPPPRPNPGSKNYEHHSTLKISESRRTLMQHGVCFNFWETGSCEEGHECKFNHVREGEEGDLMKVPEKLGPNGRKKRYVKPETNDTYEPHSQDVICHCFAKRGWCIHGDKCWNQHIDLVTTKEIKVRFSVPTKDAKDSTKGSEDGAAAAGPGNETGVTDQEMHDGGFPANKENRALRQRAAREDSYQVQSSGPFRDFTNQVHSGFSNDFNAFGPYNGQPNNSGASSNRVGFGNTRQYTPGFHSRAYSTYQRPSGIDFGGHGNHLRRSSMPANAHYMSRVESASNIMRANGQVPPLEAPQVSYAEALKASGVKTVTTVRDGHTFVDTDVNNSDGGVRLDAIFDFSRFNRATERSGTGHENQADETTSGSSVNPPAANPSTDSEEQPTTETASGNDVKSSTGTSSVTTGTGLAPSNPSRLNIRRFLQKPSLKLRLPGRSWSSKSDSSSKKQ